MYLCSRAIYVPNLSTDVDIYKLSLILLQPNDSDVLITISRCFKMKIETSDHEEIIVERL